MTERSESERAELEALADRLEQQGHFEIYRGDNGDDRTSAQVWLREDERDLIVTALRRLAAQDQKPVALAHVRLEDDGLFADLEVLDGTNLQPSMSPVALYLSPPPAPGWDVAVEALEIIAGERQCLDNLMGHADVAAAALKALRSSPFTSDAGGGVRWRSISEDTSWIDGRDVVLLANSMEVSARYCPGEWSGETPDCPREYSGAVWSCFDDQFQFEIEECSTDPSEWSHDGVTHWRPALSTPATADSNAAYREVIDDALVTRHIGVAKGDAKAELNQILSWETAVALDPRVSSDAQALIDQGRNASAEARLREALEHYAKEYCEGWCEQDAGCAQFDHDCGGCLARRALSAHPNASDCDKQGERK